MKLPVSVHREGDTAIGIVDADGKVYGSLHDIAVAINKSILLAGESCIICGQIIWEV